MTSAAEWIVRDLMLDQLHESDGEHWLHVMIGSPQAAGSVAWYLRQDRVTRTLRGRKMRTVQHLYDEVAAALQFPYYFGENWNAFSECIADLDWLRGPAYALIVNDASELLVEEPSGATQIFLKVLSRAAKEWGTANPVGRTWDHEPIAFHVILQVTEEERSALEERLCRLGVDYDLLNRTGPVKTDMESG